MQGAAFVTTIDIDYRHFCWYCGNIFFCNNCYRRNSCKPSKNRYCLSMFYNLCFRLGFPEDNGLFNVLCYKIVRTYIFKNVSLVDICWCNNLNFCFDIVFLFSYEVINKTDPMALKPWDHFLVNFDVSYLRISLEHYLTEFR